MSTTVYVRVTCLLSEPSDPDDAEIAGVYGVRLNDEVPSDRQADAALDAFHAEYGVEEPDDFEFEVLDAEGRELDSTADHEDMSLEHAGEVIASCLTLHDAIEATRELG